MAKQPTLNGKVLIKALLRAGFEVNRVSGSHHILKHPGPPPRAVTIPVHRNKEVKQGTLSSILRQAGLTIEDIVRLL